MFRLWYLFIFKLFSVTSLAVSVDGVLLGISGGLSFRGVAEVVVGDFRLGDSVSLLLVLSREFVKSDTILELDQVMDVLTWILEFGDHSKGDEEHGHDPEESSSPGDSESPSGIDSSTDVLELSDPSDDVDDKDEDWDDDLEEELHELWHSLLGSQEHESLEIVESEEEPNEDQLAHQAEEQLNVSGVTVKQVEDIESSLDAEHETPDEAEEAHNDAPDFLGHSLSDLGEEILRELHEEIDKSEDGVDSQAEAHGEENHREEVLPWQKSEKGGEHHEQKLWSRLGQVEHGDALLS